MSETIAQRRHLHSLDIQQAMMEGHSLDHALERDLKEVEDPVLRLPFGGLLRYGPSSGGLLEGDRTHREPSSRAARHGAARNRDCPHDRASG